MESVLEVVLAGSISVHMDLNSMKECMFQNSPSLRKL